ncbi:MAG: thiamine-phosphate kinase [Candidatus Saganbacteria bacterium]|nr:thiamine-phosphate kinase [Candidatus Saganbacteria bacterium]
MRLSQLGEFGLIELLKKSSAKRKDTVIGIGDDCAVLQLKTQGSKRKTNELILVTTDTLVEDVHFRLRDVSFYDLGYYALFINISDIASMGGQPTHAFVTIGAPADTNVRNIKSLYHGLGRLAKKYKLEITGGDTIASDKLIVSITLLGTALKRYLLTRAGARPGDMILATGQFGGPAANNYRIPHSTQLVPKVELAQKIAKSKLATAMIDSSDGLARSVMELCCSSKTGALIFEDEIPRAKGASRHQALHGGEEYELVFTAPANNVSKLSRLLKGTELSVVGQIRPQSKAVCLLASDGRTVKLTKAGFEHFK